MVLIHILSMSFASPADCSSFSITLFSISNYIKSSSRGGGERR